MVRNVLANSAASYETPGIRFVDWRQLAAQLSEHALSQVPSDFRRRGSLKKSWATSEFFSVTMSTWPCMHAATPQNLYRNTCYKQADHSCNMQASSKWTASNLEFQMHLNDHCWGILPSASASPLYDKISNSILLPCQLSVVGKFLQVLQDPVESCQSISYVFCTSGCVSSCSAASTGIGWLCLHVLVFMLRRPRNLGELLKELPDIRRLQAGHSAAVHSHLFLVHHGVGNSTRS